MTKLKAEREQASGKIPRSFPFDRWRWALPAIIAIVVAVLAAWRLILPATLQPLGAVLSEHDKQDIAHLCRLHTIRFAGNKLANGEFSWFLRSARVLFRQKIDRLIDDHDGTYRVYVVVYDR